MAAAEASAQSQAGVGLRFPLGLLVLHSMRFALLVQWGCATVQCMFWVWSKQVSVV